MSLQINLRDGITQLLLDRPHRANAYDHALLTALGQAISECTTPVLLIGATGQGAFCAGADLQALGRATPLDALDLLSQRVFDKLARFPGVSVAAIGGPAVAGGVELALACDLRICSPKAFFKLPETGMGLIPAAGGCSRLPALIGLGRAKEMVFLGQPIPAQRALAWGLVNAVEEHPLQAALEMGEQLLARSSLALRLAKGVLNPTLQDSLAQERTAEALLYSLRPEETP